jgi:hypothetical protein
MNRRLSRLAQLREDLNVALVLLLLGVALGGASLLSSPHTPSSLSPSPVSPTP